MSPDQLWQSDGKMASYAGTPTEFRRESIRSSLSMMKQKIFGTTQGGGMGRSCTSIDRLAAQCSPIVISYHDGAL